MAKKVPPPPPSSETPPPAPPVKTKRRAKHEILLPSKNARSERAIMRIMLVFFRNPQSTLLWAYENTTVGDDDDSPMAREWVTLDTVRGRSQRDGWFDHRARFWAGIRDDVLAVAKQEIVQQEIEEIGTLREIQKELLPKIKNTELKPNTLEGAINAYVRLDQRIGEKRMVVAAKTSDVTAPPPPREAGAEDAGAPGHGRLVIPEVEDGMTEAEVQEIAMQVAMRRAGLLPAAAPANGIDTDEAHEDVGEE